jgi:hypothetical protein
LELKDYNNGREDVDNAKQLVIINGKLAQLKLLFLAFSSHYGTSK